MEMAGAGLSELERAMRCLPTGCFVMTSAYDGKRAGMRVRSVQACADDPLLISVAARKGHKIDPLIRDSRSFAVCVMAPGDRLVDRAFPAETGTPRTGVTGNGSGNGAHVDASESDPFDALPHSTMVTGAPILDRAIAVFDCEVARRIDLEADHELFVGQVMRFRCVEDIDAALRPSA
ncbi:MAG: flavin reductase family protein [Phycisphaerales bacterium JB059]